MAGGLTFAAIAAALALLASGLPGRTFYTGDPGVKLVAARNVAAHPDHPLDIPLPRIGGRPAPYVDPFFAIHGDHSHAITPELFPIATAPMIAAFGPRGVYVLPAVGFLLAIAATAWLGVLLDGRRHAPTLMLTALLGTPLLFYGLEFWEHAPAAGLAGLAACLIVRGARWPVPWATLPGLMFGIAILLRPEVVWFAAAVLAASRWLPQPPGTARTMAVVVGALLALIPIVVRTFLHFGAIITPHVAGNPALWSPGWPGRRLSIFTEWFVDIGPANAWITAPVLLLCLVSLIVSSTRQGRPFLLLLAGITVFLTWLSAPNSGGGQWGPRYLLPAFIPIAIVAADVFQGLGHRRRVLTVLLVVSAAVAGLAIQRMSYQRLRGTKETYGRVLGLVESMTPAGGYAVTDLWWLDQVAASADRRVFLYAADAETGGVIVRQLQDARTDHVTIFGSREESGDQSPWTVGTCYVVDERQEIPERTLVAVRLRRDCAR